MTELLSEMRPDLDLVDVLGGSLVIDPARFAGRRPAIKIKVERSREPSRIDTPPCASTSSAVTTTTSMGTLSLGKEERRQKGKEEAEDAFVREFLTEYRSSDSRLSFLGKVSYLLLFLRVSLASADFQLGRFALPSPSHSRPSFLFSSPESDSSTARTRIDVSILFHIPNIHLCRSEVSSFVL